MSWHLALEWCLIRFPQAPPSRRRSWFRIREGAIPSPENDGYGNTSGDATRFAGQEEEKEEETDAGDELGPDTAGGLGAIEDQLTLQRSVDFVLALVRYEITVNKVNASRIFVGGFGQGGALALAVAMQSTGE